jgi:hypothetical protein
VSRRELNQAATIVAADGWLDGRDGLEVQQLEPKSSGIKGSRSVRKCSLENGDGRKTLRCNAVDDHAMS